MRNKNLLLLLADKKYGIEPYRILREMEKSQYYSTEKLEEMQLNYLKALVAHSVKHVPFYKEYAASHDVTINTLDDIKKLPIVDKKFINSRYDDFVADDAKKPYFIAKTTGSSGVPFAFIKDRVGEGYKIASRLRCRNWFGIGRCDKVLKVSGIPPVGMNWIWHLKEFIRFKATNKSEIFISEMTDDNIPNLVKKINKINPVGIIGLAGGVALLAVKLKDNPDLKVNIKAIFTNSESITPLQRKQIMDCFGVEPRSDYAATEGSIAQECEYGHMHVMMEECYVEIINEDENGVGDLVLTVLHSIDMPLIRYRIGDKARWRKGKCECGRGLVMIDDVLGRETDVIVLPNGKEYSSANINYVPSNLKYINNLAGYQLFQTAKDQVLLKMVLVDKNDHAVVDEMKEEFEKIFEGCTLTVEICDELEHGKGGKLRIVNALKQ